MGISDESINAESIKGWKILWYKSANVPEEDRIDIKNSLVRLEDHIKEAMKFTRNRTLRMRDLGHTEVTIDLYLGSNNPRLLSTTYFLMVNFELFTYDCRAIVEENSDWNIQIYRKEFDPRLPHFRGELVGKIGGATRYERSYEEDTI